MGTYDHWWGTVGGLFAGGVLTPEEVTTCEEDGNQKCCSPEDEAITGKYWADPL